MEDFTIYNPEGSNLRNVQQRMLEMLEYIDSVCEKNNIKYWISSGTLLGAVRHNGFIPWDDDLDIELPWEEYKKLIRVLKKEKTSKYTLQTSDIDRNYIFPYAKLRDLSSVIKQSNNADRNFKFKGIFIDIFYLDKGNHFLARFTNSVQKLLFSLSIIKNDSLGILLFIKVFLRFFIHNLLFPILRFLTRISNIKLFILPFGTGFTAPRDINDIFPLQKIQFEGKYFNAPSNTDAYLRKIYGDYRKLPDMKNRIFHSTEYEFV